jgi:cytochrome c-type biogenesis protein CcmF
MTGAKFIAVLTIEAPGETKVVNPYVQIKGPGQLDRPVVDIGRGMGIYVDSINAADKSASLVIKYLTPAYPLEIYYKPLTILVWWGVGIMGLGGLLAAYYRRIDRRKDSQSPDRSTPDESNQGETRQENATQELTEV